jgi:hypothetical protein
MKVQRLMKDHFSNRYWFAVFTQTGWVTVLANNANEARRKVNAQ